EAARGRDRREVSRRAESVHQLLSVLATNRAVATCFGFVAIARAMHCARLHDRSRVMHKIQRTIEIKAPVQRVYDFLNQPTNLPSIWPNMVSVSNIVAKPGGAHDFDWVYKMIGVPFKGHSKVEEAQPA